MPRGKWIDKKTATHFTLVHRPQNDPLIHDDAAPSMVLNPTHLPNASKSKRLGDLASELGSDAMSIRDNEGEAATYGVYFDDTEYDYMQHLRDLDQGGGEAVFVEAKGDKEKGKGKQSLEEALRQMDLQHRSDDLIEEEMLPSKNLQRQSYQVQQDVPDAIAGFQPDMDPRLREALEALEDDAYAVGDDEDLFKELAGDGQELDDYEFDETYEGFEDDDGWESDGTVKPDKETQDEAPKMVAQLEQPEEGPSGDWMEDFKKFQKDQKGEKKPAAAAAKAAPSEVQSSLFTTTTNGGRTKRRKGAMTSKSGYSMTSSSLVRTEQLSILDARFDKIEEEYNADMDDMASVSAVSAVSSVQGPVRSDFDNILDEFLGNHTMSGKKHVKRGKYQSGLEQLEEIRKGLGPARLPGRKGRAS